METLFQLVLSTNDGIKKRAVQRCRDAIIESPSKIASAIGRDVMYSVRTGDSLFSNTIKSMYFTETRFIASYKLCIGLFVSWWET